MTRYGFCPNCGAVKYYGRWCRDCVRMSAKTVVAELLAAGVLYLVRLAIR